MSWINNLRLSVKLSAVFAAICLVIGISSATIYRSLGIIEFHRENDCSYL